MFAVPVVQAQAASPSISSLINKGNSALNAIGVGDQVNRQSKNPSSSHTQPTAAHCAANQTTTPSDCPGFYVGSFVRAASNWWSQWGGPINTIACIPHLLTPGTCPIATGISISNSVIQCVKRLSR